MLLSGKELCVIKPDLRHGMHVDKSSFVQLIDDFVELRLGDEVKLFYIESGFLQVVEPKFVAARQVGQSALIQRRSDFKLLLGLG